MRANKRSGPCDVCGEPVGEREGFLIGPYGGWSLRCVNHKPTPPERIHADAWRVPGLASFDLETTGVVPKKDRIVSAGFVTESDEETELLINPGIPIPAWASKVHGITDEDVADAISANEGIAMVASWITGVIERQIPVVVYNAPYDLTMLRAEIDRYDIAQPKWDSLIVIDPLVIDWGIERGRLGPRKLNQVCDYYEIELIDAHTAVADARAARLVAYEMAARQEILNGVSFDDLMKMQMEWFAQKTEEWNDWAKTQPDRSTGDPSDWPMARS